VNPLARPSEITHTLIVWYGLKHECHPITQRSRSFSFNSDKNLLARIETLVVVRLLAYSLLEREHTLCVFWYRLLVTSATDCPDHSFKSQSILQCVCLFVFCFLLFVTS
jgi:hypothetical protein